MLWITLVLFIVGEALAGVPFYGVCPDVKSVPNFDVAKFMGKWYEVEAYFSLSEVGGKCVSDNYVLAKNGSVLMKTKVISSETGKTTSIDGIATLNSKSGNAEFTIRYPTLGADVKLPYLVLGTDYKRWALTWICENFGLYNIRRARILTRERNPLVSVLEEAFEVAEKNRIARCYFFQTDQKHCPNSY